MPSYQPFLIADFTFGEHQGKEPWLAPEAAWRTLTNAYVKNGRVRKRAGYTLLGELSDIRTVMGIFENRMLDGSTELIVITDRRLFRLEAGVFVERSGGDVWTGTDLDYFSVAHAADDAMYIVNGVNVPKKWRGTVPSLGNAATTGLSAALNWARWTLWWKGRLWYFFTNEGGGSVRFPQRARFSQVNQPEAFRDVDFIEATTSERMTGVQLLGERVIVYFEDSTWTIVETGDFRLPFVFRRIPSIYGAVGRMASFPAGDITVSLSRYGLVGTNGDRVQKIDPELPKLMDRIKPDKQGYTYGGYDNSLLQGWLLYVNSGTAAKPIDALIYDWDLGTFAFYSPYRMHVLGTARASDSLTWSDLTDPWDTTHESWDDLGTGADEPLLLGGTRLGQVYVLNKGTLDDGSAFTMVAKSERINPFKGMSARMGYLDIHCDPSSDPITVKVYRDKDPGPVVAKTIDLVSVGSTEKVMRRIAVNKAAQFFTIEIEHSGTDRFALDAIRLWMAPNAKGRAF